MLEMNISAIGSFKQMLSARKLSDNTIAQYEDVLTEFFEQIAKPYKEVKIADLGGYWEWKRSENKKREEKRRAGLPASVGRITKQYCSSTMNRTYSILREFYSFNEMDAFAEKIKAMRARQVDWKPHVFDAAKITKIFELATAEAVYREQDKTGVHIPMLAMRDHLLVRFLFLTGARISEAAGAKTTDVSREKGELLIKLLGKGNKDRKVPLLESWNKEFEQYAKSRRSKEPYLFTTKTGNGLAVSTAKSIVRAICEQAGIEGITSAHKFRHGFTTALLDAGTPLNRVRELLGHSNISTTSKYVDAMKLGSQADVAVLAKFLPKETKV